jgi:uncharacterized protein YciI
MKKLLAALFIGLSLYIPALSQETRKSEEKKQQFIYVLKLVPRLLNEKNWTASDNEIVGKHFRRLQQLKKEGRVVMAGRTLNDTEPSQFGIVILEVTSQEEARRIMSEDDAVKEKVMTAELFPFRVALIR